MNAIINLHDGVFSLINRVLGTWFLPTLARFSFAAVLLVYFWKSAKTKLGDGFLGFLSPSDNGYIQVFPKKFEELGYDSSQFGFLETLIVTAGTWAEFILPLLIVIGLCTRLAAIGMIGFVFVQSVVDITGHGVTGKTLGAWFDGPSDALILDQRLLWMVLFGILIVKGAGPLSVDAFLRRSRI
ncbi:MAG: DoxX family protein [Rhodobacteraceae bacterium]|nr:DoxX family protein [Paracoccaceae bacterium]